MCNAGANPSWSEISPLADSKQTVLSIWNSNGDLHRVKLPPSYFKSLLAYYLRILPSSNQFWYSTVIKSDSSNPSIFIYSTFDSPFTCILYLLCSGFSLQVPSPHISFLMFLFSSLLNPSNSKALSSLTAQCRNTISLIRSRGVYNRKYALSFQLLLIIYIHLSLMQSDQ